MSTKQTGGPAFPHGEISAHPQNEDRTPFPASSGMTLRDWFAGMALHGAQDALTQLAIKGVTRENPTDDGATIAYQVADAMLAERSKS